ncbi:helix-turn-helix transcriptional regulator [Roseibium suaedae]|uniref:Predicted DNA-binding transcriptional regulator YafY, contains an HTH and WYL domains n=1 Tax=Roseibium suaedae TaxID=735517 RepID=A0A1M7FMD2_9HYPH|nr:YafY family protein [Roseibium suaedae]SHM04898.1 Predicted DNA-binding transcriptional regulator YafY, contains an HTH and WYL domains [Roseibium suaedae]
MRASRLLSILLTLQARGHVTAQELAEDCEVSLRTIYRDIDALSSAGIPVYSERGSEGGYRLLDGYKTRLNGLSAMEADALFLAGLPGPAADLGLGAVMNGAKTKLLTALPDSLRDSAAQMQNRFHLDIPAWFAESEQPDFLPEIADAIWNQRQIDIRYRSWTGEKQRRLSPLGIVLKSGAWYLIASSESEPRTFRISRVLEFKATDETFERPEGFNLANHWHASTRRLDEELHPRRARLRLSPWGRRMFEALMSPYICAKTTFADDADAEGWIEAEIPTGSVRQACADLLRFGGDVEVLEPADLRAAMAETARQLGRFYLTSKEERSGSSASEHQPADDQDRFTGQNPDDDFLTCGKKG